MSQDLRERIAHAVEGGTSARAAAERFAVSASAAIKLMQRVRQTGSTAPAKIGGHRRPILEPHAATLRTIATSKPGITLKEMRDALHARGIAVRALSTVCILAADRNTWTVGEWPRHRISLIYPEGRFQIDI